MLRRALFLLGLAPALAACSPSPGPAAPDAGPDAGPHGCPYGFLGDASMQPALEVIALDTSGDLSPLTSSPVKDGGTIALLLPPQGGRVIFAGVRATNLDACGVQLDGALRDETTKQVRLDQRTINLVPSGDGWGQSNTDDPSTFANVPVCPNEWSKTNLYGTEYQLEMSVTDKNGRTASLALEVTPTCAEPQNLAQCLCICQGGYVLGQSCAPDGGADGGADGGDAGDGG